MKEEDDFMLETQDLILRRADDERDNGPFLAMLKEDGNFRELAGIEYSDENLLLFDHYLTQRGACRYAIFEKDRPEKMIGYVGLCGEELPDLDFYIQRGSRNRGFCTEAVMAFLERVERGDVMLPGPPPRGVQASTLCSNMASIRVLEKCGFRRVGRGAAICLSSMAFPNGETRVNALAKFERPLLGPGRSPQKRQIKGW